MYVISEKTSKFHFLKSNIDTISIQSFYLHFFTLQKGESDMDEKYFLSEQNYEDDLFCETKTIPDEFNPFDNFTEHTDYNESYSMIIPTLFFRNTPLSMKPSRFEASRLRHIYNISGMLLSTGIIIKITVYLIFYAIILMYSVSEFSLQSVGSVFRQFISDTSVRYSLMSIATILSSLVVFFAGYRFSGLNAFSFFKNNHSAKTSEIITFFMTGIFIVAVGNVIVISSTILPFDFTNSRHIYSNDIFRSILIFMYTCIIVPVSEGFIFRGLILKNMSRANHRFGIIITSFLCALACGNILEVIPCYMMSVLLCKITLKYGTLLHSVIIHITVNICNTIILAYGDIFFKSDILILEIWTVLIFITGGIFAIYSFMKEPLPKSKKIQRKRSTSLILTSFTIPPVILMYILLLISNTI